MSGESLSILSCLCYGDSYIKITFTRIYLKQCRIFYGGEGIQLDGCYSLMEDQLGGDQLGGD